jgi:hypothetical protein
VQLHDLAQRWDREPLVVRDVPLSREVAEDERVRRRPVVEAERDAGVLLMKE